MNRSIEMPWDEFVRNDYDKLEKDNVQESETIGTNDKNKYGQSKPIRITIVGDITSDNN